MSSKTKGSEVLIPFQVKVRADVRERVLAEAEKRGLSATDIASLAIAAGIDKVVQKLDEIVAPEKKAA